MADNDLRHAWENDEMPFGDMPDGTAVFETCEFCGRGIQEGEWFHLIDGNPMCSNCLEERRRKAG